MYPTLLYEWGKIYTLGEPLYPTEMEMWINMLRAIDVAGRWKIPKNSSLQNWIYPWWRRLKELNRGPWQMASPETANNLKFPPGGLNSRLPPFRCYFDTEAIRPSSWDQLGCNIFNCKFGLASHMSDGSDSLYRPFLAQCQCAPSQDIAPKLHRSLSSVKSIKVSCTSICIWSKVFATISIQIKLQRELVTIINLNIGISHIIILKAFQLELQNRRKIKEENTLLRIL